MRGPICDFLPTSASDGEPCHLLEMNELVRADRDIYGVHADIRQIEREPDLALLQEDQYHLTVQSLLLLQYIEIFWVHYVSNHSEEQPLLRIPKRKEKT